MAPLSNPKSRASSSDPSAPNRVLVLNPLCDSMTSTSVTAHSFTFRLFDPCFQWGYQRTSGHTSHRLKPLKPPFGSLPVVGLYLHDPNIPATLSQLSNIYIRCLTASLNLCTLDCMKDIKGGCSISWVEAERGRQVSQRYRAPTLPPAKSWGGPSPCSQRLRF